MLYSALPAPPLRYSMSIVRSNGTDRHRFTNGEIEDAFAADGRHVVYVLCTARTYSGNRCPGAKLVVAGLDGRGSRVLSTKGYGLLTAYTLGLPGMGVRAGDGLGCNGGTDSMSCISEMMP